ncbi:MAG: 50S ribosomal protein L25 [Nitrospirae bacterium]|nr:MAG: 50S ribosomal protein L25 [Nitrospirota bacterium]
MSATVPLPCEPRTATGKSAARRLRREGRLPAVLYGGGGPATPLAVPVRELVNLLKHHPRNVRLELELEGGRRQAVIKALDVHPVTRRPLHVDLLEVAEDRPVTLEVPLRIVGQDPIGVRHGGILQVVRDRVKVRCLPAELPEAIEVDLAELDSGQAFTVGELTTPVAVLAPPETVLFKILAPRISKTPAAAAAAAAAPAATAEAGAEQ